jgi:hypothetical protein
MDLDGGTYHLKEVRHGVPAFEWTQAGACPYRGV